MTPQLKKKIVEHYQKGQGSIQDIARFYRLTVEEVLEVLGLTNLTNVTVRGDLIDESEAGPNAHINREGTTHRVPFSLN